VRGVIGYVVRRLAASVPSFFVATFVLFWAVRSTFDPAERFLGSRDPDALLRFRAKWGLDDPIPVQYLRWIGNAVRGDLGVSSSTNEAVTTMLARAFTTTAPLVVAGLVVSALVAVAVGAFSAVRQYSVPDHLLSGLSYVGVAVPPFVFGLLGIQVLGVMLKEKLGLDEPVFYFVGLRSSGAGGFGLDYLRHLVLPVATLSVQMVAIWSRFQRAAMLDVLGSDFVRTARAKGVPRRRVVTHHALRNALLPLVTVMAVDAALLFGGVIVTENLFSIPGMGRLFFHALQTGDAHVVMGWLLVTGTLVIVFNLLADVAYAALDPRARLS
jgi:peptide/nickel transport system permease protein